MNDYDVFMKQIEKELSKPNPDKQLIKKLVGDAHCPYLDQYVQTAMASKTNSPIAIQAFSNITA